MPRSKFLRLVQNFLWMLLLIPHFAFTQLRMLVRFRRRHWSALARIRAGLTSRQHPKEALTPAAPGVFEVRREWIQEKLGEPPAGADSSRSRLTVLHFLGAAENVWSPLGTLPLLLRADPRIGTATHLIVDTPYSVETLASFERLVERYWEVLDSTLPPSALEFVLLGLNRGALAALSLAPRLAGRRGAKVSVLAVATPIAANSGRATTARLLGDLSFSMAQLARFEAHMPRTLKRGWRALLRANYAAGSGFVLAELDMADDALLEWTAYDLDRRHPFDACLRVVDEFASYNQLGGEPARKLTSRALCDIAGDPRIHTWLLWGARDAWQSASDAADEARAQVAALPEGRDRIQIRVLPDWNHGVGRQVHHDYGSFGAFLLQAVDAVSHKQRSSARPPPQVVQG